MDRVPARDVAAWVEVLGRYLADDALVDERRASLQGYDTPRWADTGAEVADVLLRGFR